MYQRLGYYLQMVAAFLLLALTHYFAAAFLPVADCDETFNFIEPIHYLLYGSGKQTWELCTQYALRSWLFSWIYAWPAVFIRGAASLSSADVYFYLRIFNGRIAALAELFFVYSVWSAFSGKAAMVALLLLLVNYPIPHAAVSVLPTSFAMICNFVVLGCWLRTRDCTSVTLSKVDRAASRGLRWSVGLALFFCVFGGVTGWPFAGLVSVPIGVDLLLRFPRQAVLYTAAAAVAVVAAGLVMDAHYYCRWTLSGWNVVRYNVLGGADRGPDLFDVEPWFFFWKNLLLNFHLMFVAVLLAPLVVLWTPRRPNSVQRPAGGFDSSSDACRHASISRSSNSGGGGGGGEAMCRFASNEDVRPTGHAPPDAPTSPLTRARLNRGNTPDRRSSPLLNSRHPHFSTAAGVSNNSNSCAAVHGFSRGRELLYMTPFFVWFVFWMCIAHKEERFMSPAYPFMVLAATRAICFGCFPDVDGESQTSTPAMIPSPSSPPTPVPPPALTASTSPPAPRAAAAASLLAWRRTAGYVFLLLFFLLSYSRAMAVYTFYSGPERIFYDWYPVLQAEAQRRWAAKRLVAASLPGAEAVRMMGTTPQQTEELKAYFTLCLGREWYRFPSSFFLDHRYTRYQFMNTTHFHGMLPVSFVTAAAGSETGFLRAPSADAPAHAPKTPRERGSGAGGGSCTCGAERVNDLNQEITEQYVQDPVVQCDAVFDSLSPPTQVSAAQHARELAQLHLDTVFTRSLLNATALREVLATTGELYHPVDNAYAVMDVDRTPLWCRVLYYPFGISRRCAVWRPLVLSAKP